MIDSGKKITALAKNEDKVLNVLGHYINRNYSDRLLTSRDLDEDDRKF